MSLDKIQEIFKSNLRNAIKQRNDDCIYIY